ASGADAGSGPAQPKAPTLRQPAIDALRIRHEMRDKVNAVLLGVVSGSIDPTDLGKATDLAISLGATRDGLRPLLVIGKLTVQNAVDIVFARGIDIGIVQSDVLAALKRDPPFPGIENYLRYVTKLYDEEVHIVAGADIESIKGSGLQESE